MERATVWTRLRAAAHGEISAETPEAYRRASLAILNLIEDVEATRTRERGLGQTPWTLPPGEGARMAAAWNAFVLQRLGTAFLDADYHDDPRSVGFIPRITAAQVMAFFTPVEGWLARAERARRDPNYRIDVPLPAALPAWSEIEPCPHSHLHGMLEAMRTIRDHACEAVTFLGDAPPENEDHARQYHAIQGLFASADAKARYAEDLHGSHPTQAVHELVEPIIKEAIESLHRVGQFVAMPRLADAPPPPPPASRFPAPTVPSHGTSYAPSHMPPVPLPSSTRLPHELGFDPWCLTDSHARRGLERDAEAQRAIRRLWRYDPEPRATLALLDEIQTAERTGAIVRALRSDGKPVGHFFCCPWGTVYEARRGQHLGDHWLAPGQRFVLDVTAEGTELGHPFRRGLKIGDFRPTDEMEYGDPSEPPDH